MILRIHPPTKKCPKCGTNRIHLYAAVRFRDETQIWKCSECQVVWSEPNGVLASDMENSLAARTAAGIDSTVKGVTT